MTRIAHLTDLHFGASDPAIVAALTADLSRDPPDLVAISGDLTQGARRPEFRAAKAFMDALPCPVLAVPGNHDITPYRLVERFLAPYERWHEEIGPETEPVWQNGSVAVLGLNTARRASPHLDWSRGSITSRRLARLLAKIDTIPAGLTRIVVAHHPLLLPESQTAVPITTQVVSGAARALAAFAGRGVKLVLAGHLHRSYSRLDPRLISGASPGPLILQGGSATSTRLRGERNAYNLVTIAADGGIAVASLVWTGQNWADAPVATGQA